MPDENSNTNTDSPAKAQADEQVQPVSQATPSPSSPDNQPGQETPVPPITPDGSIAPPPPIVEKVEPPSQTAPTTEGSPPATPTEQNGGDINLPPVVDASAKDKKKGPGKRIIATILGILVLIGGVGAGVILVQRQQDIRERAAVISDTCADLGGTCVPSSYSCTGGTMETADCNISQHNKTCGFGSCSAPTPKPTTPQPPPQPECTDDGDCPMGKICQNNQCQTTSPTPPPAQCIDPTTSSARGAACQNTSGTFTGNCVVIYCPNGLGADGKCNLNDTGAWQKFGSCSSLWNSLGEGQCGQVDTVNESNVYCNAEGVCESKIVNRTDCSKTPTKPSPSTPTPTPQPPTEPPSEPVTAACHEIKVYDTNWNQITDLSTLKAGDTIRFTVSGQTTSGTIDMARFRVNSPAWRAAVTQKRPGTQEFYDEYTIPEGVTSFTVNAQLHHTSLGWF